LTERQISRFFVRKPKVLPTLKHVNLFSLPDMQTANVTGYTTISYNNEKINQPQDSAIKIKGLAAIK
jgi:hypothetical protein